MSSQTPFKIKLSLKTVKLEGIDIDWKKEIKCLGLNQQNKFLKNMHEKDLVNKATNALIVCSNIVIKIWGYNSTIL